ncbi:MAG TPA: hypothetical protein VNV41_20615 [Candidatus Acidoferrales bacterium]|jgi:hypothetical protein|nr:hypothetical protein [Candidatus Acidoferrales bacterium]
MKFAKIVFWGAGIWGLVTLAPLYFLVGMIGRQDPPAVTHPLFFYGFVGVALAWQFAFFVIASDPVRFRRMMIPSVLEKLAFGIPAIVLYTQRRLSVSDLGLGCIDLFLGALFLLAFRSTAP